MFPFTISLFVQLDPVQGPIYLSPDDNWVYIYSFLVIEEFFLHQPYYWVSQQDVEKLITRCFR